MARHGSPLVSSRPLFAFALCPRCLRPPRSIQLGVTHASRVCGPAVTPTPLSFVSSQVDPNLRLLTCTASPARFVPLAALAESLTSGFSRTRSPPTALHTPALCFLHGPVNAQTEPLSNLHAHPHTPSWTCGRLLNVNQKGISASLLAFREKSSMTLFPHYK